MRANVCKSMGVAVLERLMLLYSITIEAAEHMRITKLSEGKTWGHGKPPTDYMRTRKEKPAGSRETP